MPDSGNSTTCTIAVEEAADGTLDGRARAAYLTQERRKRDNLECRLDGVIRRARQLLAYRLYDTPFGRELPEHIATAPVEVLDDPAGVHHHIVQMTVEGRTFPWIPTTSTWSRRARRAAPSSASPSTA